MFTLVSSQVSAQTWPSKLVRVVVSLPAGSATDIVSRALSERLSQQTGQPFVVENRPGASGSIAQAMVAKAEPDGYTILVHSSSGTVVSSTIANLPFDVLKDFSGITMLANIPNALAVPPGKGFASVKELIAFAKTNPGKINYATVGTSSATHLNAERFRRGRSSARPTLPGRWSAPSPTHSAAWPPIRMRRSSAGTGRSTACMLRAKSPATFTAPRRTRWPCCGRSCSGASREEMPSNDHRWVLSH